MGCLCFLPYMISWHIACIASAGFPEEACCFAPLFPKNRLFCYAENQTPCNYHKKGENAMQKTYVLDTNVLIQAPMLSNPLRTTILSYLLLSWKSWTD